MCISKLYTAKEQFNNYVKIFTKVFAEILLVYGLVD